MATLHQFMHCDHSRPNGIGSQVMRMIRIEHLDNWSIGLLALMKTKAEERAIVEEDMFNNADPYGDCLCDACTKTNIPF